MANLSNPTLQVDILTGMPDTYQLTATVNVELTSSEICSLADCGFPLELRSDVWGDDGQFNGADDYLVSFPTQNITGPGIYTFKAVVPRGVLNEDNSMFDKTDEVYDRFSLVSKSNLFPINVPSVTSPVITGKF